MPRVFDFDDDVARARRGRRPAVTPARINTVTGTSAHAIDRLVDVLGPVLPLERRRIRQEAMLGNERVLRHDRVAAGALHADHEPGVFDGDVGDRHQRQPEVRHLAALVVHVDAARHPLRVQAAGRPRPAARHAPSSVDGNRHAAGRERSGNPRVAIGAPDVLLRALGKQAGQPLTDVDEAGDPRRGSRSRVRSPPSPRCTCGCSSGSRRTASAPSAGTGRYRAGRGRPRPAGAAANRSVAAFRCEQRTNLARPRYQASVAVDRQS